MPVTGGDNCASADQTGCTTKPRPRDRAPLKLTGPMKREGNDMMRLGRTLIIGTAIALSALAILGVGDSSGVNGPRMDTVGQHQIALAAVTAGTEPAGRDVLPPVGPIPCLDGSTVDLGQFCPLPTIQCANGTTVPVGQF